MTLEGRSWFVSHHERLSLPRDRFFRKRKRGYAKNRVSAFESFSFSPQIYPIIEHGCYAVILFSSHSIVVYLDFLSFIKTFVRMKVSQEIHGKERELV
jgi:hypothetical protein